MQVIKCSAFLCPAADAQGSRLLFHKPTILFHPSPHSFHFSFSFALHLYKKLWLLHRNRSHNHNRNPYSSLV